MRVYEMSGERKLQELKVNSYKNENEFSINEIIDGENKR